VGAGKMKLFDLRNQLVKEALGLFKLSLRTKFVLLNVKLIFFRRMKQLSALVQLKFQFNLLFSPKVH